MGCGASRSMCKARPEEQSQSESITSASSSPPPGAAEATPLRPESAEPNVQKLEELDVLKFQELQVERFGNSSAEGQVAEIEAMPSGPGGLSPAQELANFKEQKRLKKKASKLKRLRSENHNHFLSHVPEFDADVQYRFTFYVVGDFADSLAEKVCTSTEVPVLKGGGSECMISPFASEGSMEMEEESSLVSEDVHEEIGTRSASPTRSRSGKYATEGYRCLCPVPYPWGRLSQAEMSKYAKLVLKPLTFIQTLPRIKTRAEASTSALVFTILIDAVDDMSLEQQLEDVLAVVRKRREAPKELRPVWAVILCHSGTGSEGTRLEEGWEPWSEVISNFEQLHGSLWKFGPVGRQDADKLYAIFAKIASQRIYTAQNPDNDSMEPMVSEMSPCEDSSGSSQPMYAAEKEDNTSGDFHRTYTPERGDSGNDFTGIAPEVHY